MALWIQPRSGPARKLDLGDVDAAWSFWADISLGRDGALAVAGSTPAHPNEIYYAAPGGGTPRRLTDFNQEIASRDLGRVEEFRWKGPNGFAEDGVVVYPPDFKPERKFPLVLLIHGGPQAASTLSFSPAAQLLAAHGYIVFSPNYRGSDNSGSGSGANRRIRLVLRRLHDIVADRALSHLESRRGGRGRQRFRARVRALR